MGKGSVRSPQKSSCRPDRSRWQHLSWRSAKFVTSTEGITDRETEQDTGAAVEVEQALGVERSSTVRHALSHIRSQVVEASDI